LVILTPSDAPKLIFTSGERAQTRFWEFFAANIRKRAHYSCCLETKSLS
jgi:hypothetical protein